VLRCNKNIVVLTDIINKLRIKEQETRLILQEHDDDDNDYDDDDDK
jgi:hypothetical protein